MAKKKVPLNPAHPERICWGCDRYCAASDLRCGNGAGRTPHPVESWGEDWATWEGEASGSAGGETTADDV